MYLGFVCNRPVHPSVSYFTADRSSMHGGILRLFHTVGTALSFSMHALRQFPNEIYRDPNSTLYDFNYESEGQRMLEAHCTSWWTEETISAPTLNLEEALHFLQEPVVVYDHPPLPFMGMGVDAWRRTNSRSPLTPGSNTQQGPGAEVCHSALCPEYALVDGSNSRPDIPLFHAAFPPRDHAFHHRFSSSCRHQGSLAHECDAEQLGRTADVATLQDRMDRIYETRGHRRFV